MEALKLDFFCTLLKSFTCSCLYFLSWAFLQLPLWLPFSGPEHLLFFGRQFCLLWNWACLSFGLWREFLDFCLFCCFLNLLCGSEQQNKVTVINWKGHLWLSPALPCTILFAYLVLTFFLSYDGRPGWSEGRHLRCDGAYITLWCRLLHLTVGAAVTYKEKVDGQQRKCDWEAERIMVYNDQ